MYECHITIEDDTNGKLLTDLEKHINGMAWKFSKIDGDPVLGKGIKCYATNHYNSVNNTKEEVIKLMNNCAYALALDGYNVIRQKVELIVYDTKK